MKPLTVALLAAATLASAAHSDPLAVSHLEGVAPNGAAPSRSVADPSIISRFLSTRRSGPWFPPARSRGTPPFAACPRSRR